MLCMKVGWRIPRPLAPLGAAYQEENTPPFYLAHAAALRQAEITMCVLDVHPVV